jgi:hypothetical protein
MIHMKKIHAFIQLFLVAIFIIATINQAFSQNKPAKQSQKDTFDATVFSNPNVVDSYIDQTGRQVVAIKVPGVLPGKYKMPQAHPTDAAVMLPKVPAYDWSFGCSATAAAMMAGYYDNMGYPNIYTGPANGGVAPMNNSIWGHATINGEDRALCPLSATRQGLDGRTTKGHVDDYWIQSGNNDPDPYIGNWTQHQYGDCTGDFMKTNQSEFGNSDGSTTYSYFVDGSPLTATESWEGNYGLRMFFESRGAKVFGYYNQLIYNQNTLPGGFTFEQYKQQIDAGRPVLLQLSGHTVLGLGYDDSRQVAYVHNTWDYGLSELTWGGIYADMQHYMVSVMELVPLNFPILTIDPLISEVGWNEGSTDFSIISNKNWSISESADWLSISTNQGTGNGSFSAIFSQNPLPQTRTAEIIVSVPETGAGKSSGNYLLPRSFDPLLYEDFSDDVIPAGWEVQGLGQNNWNTSSYSKSVGSAAPYLHFTYYPGFVGISRMALPPINTTGITKLSLAFKQALYFFDNSPPHTFGVAVSGNGGANWQTVWSVFITSDIYAQTINIEIENAAVGSPQFRLCLFFEGESWGVWDWYIDNILLMEIKDSETVTLVQQAQPSSTQNITVNSGWSGISSYQNLADPDVENLMAPLGSNLEILLDLQHVYWPAGNVNTIVNWNPYHGYIIKSNQNASIPFSGIPVGNKTINLSQGWNILPVLCNSEVNTASLFSSIGASLVIVKEVAGSGIYWPALNINTMPTLKPGKSYFVKVNNSCSISF